MEAQRLVSQGDFKEKQATCGGEAGEVCVDESVKGCMVDHFKYGLKLGNQVIFKMVRSP